MSTAEGIAKESTAAHHGCARGARVLQHGLPTGEPDATFRGRIAFLAGRATPRGVARCAERFHAGWVSGGSWTPPIVRPPPVDGGRRKDSLEQWNVRAGPSREG